MSLELQQLAKVLDLEFDGPAELEISGVASPGSARAADLCFVQHESYLAEIASSQCGAVILPPDLGVEISGKALLYSSNPQYHFARAISVLGLEPKPARGDVHPSAEIAASARLGADVSVGALAVIGENAVIGAGSSIGAGAIIEASVSLGEQCLVHGRAMLARGVSIGDRCILHPGVIIGSDGFGLASQAERWHKIPQLGSVIIEDDVEIGANTTVDRGALDDTVIERGCKLDNQIQVAHNVRIGAHTAIAACVGIAGSASIGRCCKISGAAVVLGHLSIADNVTITAMSLVTKDIRQAGVYSSGTPLMENNLWHRANARYKSLDKLAQSVVRLEKNKS